VIIVLASKRSVMGPFTAPKSLVFVPRVGGDDRDGCGGGVHDLAGLKRQRQTGRRRRSLDGPTSLALAGEFGRRHWSAEEVTLAELAAMGGKADGLRLGLDALGQDIDMQRSTQADDRAGDSDIGRLVWHAAHEALIDLQLVDR